MNAVPQVVAEILSRVPWTEYSQMPGVSITRLKELARSPQHYQYILGHEKDTAPLRLGKAAHCMVLEPERFPIDFAVWAERTARGNLRPRNSKDWDAFEAAHAHQQIINEDEYVLACDIATAVRSHPIAAKYLEVGDPEVVMRWQLDNRVCRGRIDWLTTYDCRPTLVGLKTSRDCRTILFGNQAARLGYHLQWSWYEDGYKTIRGVEPKVVEIVVESKAPHAVAVYTIPEDIREQGRTEYDELLKKLAVCERANDWPGPHPLEEVLSFPTWAYPNHGDLADLGLED